MNETSSKARDLALAAWELDVDFNDRFNLAAHIATLHIYQKNHESLILAKKWLKDAYNLSAFSISIFRLSTNRSKSI
jgi:hypothetical protein